MNKKLSCPYKRQSIQISLKSLLDEDFRKNWSDPNYKHAFWDSLYMKVFEGLYEDTDEEVGISLYNKEEVKEFEKYLEFFNDTFEADMPDSYYINHPEWSRLLKWAREILDMMEVNNKKYNYEEEIKAWYDNGTLRDEKRIAIYEELDKIDSFSEEEKEGMRRRLRCSIIEEFDDISSEILEKIKSTKNTTCNTKLNIS